MSASTSATISSYYQSIQFREAPAATLASYVALVGSGGMSLADVRSAIINDPYTTNNVDPVVRLYQAAFGRVPESGTAIDFYADRLADGRLTIESIARSFAASPEFQARYGADVSPNAASVTALYLNVLNRAPSSSEVAWYLNSGMTAAQMLQGFAQSPEFQSRSNAAVDALLDANALGTAVFTGALQIVTAGQTFTLTTGVDQGASFTGGAGNDTFNATGTTLSQGDAINGGAGTDRLVVVDSTGASANGLPAVGQSNTNVTLTSIEAMSVDASGSIGTNAGAPQVTTYTMPTSVANVQQSNQYVFTVPGSNPAAGAQQFTYGGAAGSFQTSTNLGDNATNFAAAVNSVAGSAVAFVGTSGSASGVTTAGVVTLASANSNIRVGMAVEGTGIPTGSFVQSIKSSTEFTLNTPLQAAISSTTALTIGGGVGGVTVFGPASGATSPSIAFTAVTSGNILAPTQSLIRANVDGNIGDTVSFTYNGFTGSFPIGADQATTAGNFRAALDAIAGAEATIGGTSTVTVTSTAPGTALLPVTFSGAAANIPVGTITTPNGAGAAVVYNISSFSDLQTFTADAVGGINLRAAAGTDLSLENVGGAVNVAGGKNVTASVRDVSAVTIGATAAASGAVVVNTTSTMADGVGATTGTGTSVNVTGGTSVTVNNTLTTTGASDNSGDVFTGGAVSVGGNASTTSVSVTQTAARARTTDAVGIANGGVTILDANRGNATADSITTVTLANYGNSAIESGALTTLNLSGTAGTLGINGHVAGTNQTATTLALNLNGLSGTNTTVTLGSFSGNSSYTTVNLDSSTAASSLTNLAVSGASNAAAQVTALNISGNAALTLGDDTALTATAAITSTNTAGVTLTTALATGQTFTGGAGNDTITLTEGFTRAHSLGGGNDRVTIDESGTADGILHGTGGSVNAGEGTDTISLTAATAALASANSTFNSRFSGFEAVILRDPVGAQTVNLAGLNGANTVTTGGIVATSGGTPVAGALTINDFTSGGRLTLTSNASGAGTYTANLTNALFNTADVFNIALSSTDAFARGSISSVATGADLDTVAVAHVETVNIIVNDASTAANGSAAVVHNLGLTAAAATTITVSGNNGLNLTEIGSGGLAAVTRFDASGVVANGNGTAGQTDGADLLAVTFSSQFAGANAAATAAATVTITGGAGNDVLTGNAAMDVISGGAGVDTIRGAGGGDTLTGGAGRDAFRFAAGESGTLTGGSSITAFDVITDFTAGATGDLLDFGSTFSSETAVSYTALTTAQRATVAAEATLLAAVNAALTAASVTAAQWTAFAWQGNTYAVYDSNAAFDINAILVQLTGVDVTALHANNFA